MGISTSNAIVPVSGRRAKVIRKAGNLDRPQLVENLLFDKYTQYAGLDKATRQLIHQEVLQAVEQAAGRYSLRPSDLGAAGVWKIAKHALPVGILSGTAICTGAYMTFFSGQPLWREALAGHWGEIGKKLALDAVLAYSIYRVVKDLFSSGILHAPLAEEIHQAATLSLQRHAPLEAA